jgi:hypothetical protein
MRRPAFTTKALGRPLTSHAVDDTICRLLRLRGPHTLDALQQAMADVSWPQLLFAIDRLSRSGQIALWRTRQGDYRAVLRRWDVRGSLTDGMLAVMAGFVGTAAMTVAMEGMFRRLPQSQRYPLPPRQITEATAEAVDMNRRLNESSRLGLTLALHFGYGSTVGALYWPTMARRQWPVVLKGMAFGLTVWTGSYLGWLPTSGLLSSATQHPPRRNALMIVAHLVWGTTIAGVTHVVMSRLAPRPRSSSEVVRAQR